MKPILYLLLTAACMWPTANSLLAQRDSVELFGNRSLSVGAQVGSDIGGAVPYPLKHVPGAINAYPHINVSIGAKLAFPLYNRFSLGLECTYKRVALNADSRVENQKFDDREAGMIQYFSGTAEVEMSFTMLELPLYAKYSFGKGKHKVIAGGYYAYLFNAKFITTPVKGYTGPLPDLVDSPVNPGDLDPISFSDKLDNWDAGFLVGYELRIIPNLNLGLRFMMGFKDIFKPDNQYFEYHMLPMRGAIVISYNLANWRW